MALRARHDGPRRRGAWHISRVSIAFAILATAFLAATAAAEPHAFAVGASLARWAPDFGNPLAETGPHRLYIGFARYEARRHVWLQVKGAYWRSENDQVYGEDGTRYEDVHRTLTISGGDVLYERPLTGPLRAYAGAGVTLHRWSGLPTSSSAPTGNPIDRYKGTSVSIGYEGIAGISWKPVSYVSVDAEVRFIHGRQISNAYSDPNRSYGGWTSGAIGLSVWP